MHFLRFASKQALMPYRFPSYSTGILMQVRSSSSSSRATSWLRKMRVFLDVADPSRCTSCKASSALQGIDSMSRGRFPDISFAMGRILCGASSPVLSCTRGIVVTIFDGQLAPLLVSCGAWYLVRGNADLVPQDAIKVSAECRICYSAPRVPYSQISRSICIAIRGAYQWK